MLITSKLLALYFCDHKGQSCKMSVFEVMKFKVTLIMPMNLVTFWYGPLRATSVKKNQLLLIFDKHFQFFLASNLALSKFSCQHSLFSLINLWHLRVVMHCIYRFDWWGQSPPAKSSPAPSPRPTPCITPIKWKSTRILPISPVWPSTLGFYVTPHLR